MLRRIVGVLFLGVIVAIFVGQSPAFTAPPPTSEAGPSSAGGGQPMTGTVKGTYHLGFSEYIQNWDATTTANIKWKEDPGAVCGGNCRVFVPDGGTIDWTWRYETESCTSSRIGQIPAGAGVHSSEQVLVLAEIPGDDSHYYFFGSGIVNAQTTINCDGGFTQDVVDFLEVPGPDKINTATPVFPAASAPVSLCDQPIKIARDAKVIVGSCYAINEDDGQQQEYLKFEWNLKLCPSPASIDSIPLLPTDDDKDGDQIPDSDEQRIGTNPLCPDTDGDGLLDSWEVPEDVKGAGFDLDGNRTAEAKRDEVFGPYSGDCGTSLGPRRKPSGQNCSLVSRPNPLHKDVYVEMDWQDCLRGNCPELVLPTGFNNLSVPIDPAHHAPDMAGLLDVVNTFRNAPVQNPDGAAGVNLHILVDEAIPHTHNCDRGTAATRPTNFGTPQQRASPNLGVMAAKQVAFRYAWSGHSSVEDNGPGACPLPTFTEVLASGLGLGPLPYYDISPAGFAQPRGRDILVTLAISWICQLYTFDSPLYLPPCFRISQHGIPVAPGLFKAQISQRGGGPPVNLPLPQHVLLGVSPSQGVRQLWGRTFMNLLGYSLGVPAGSVKNDPTAFGAHPPDSYAKWEDLAYAPPRVGSLTAQGGTGDFVPILPDFTLADEDGDGDGTAEGIDNCPALANADQADLDGDGLGDDCDSDDDGDGTPDDHDASPLDTDNDGTPNTADGDADGDGAENAADNCPLQANADQANADGDAAGNACDADSDGDGQVDVLERAAGSDPLLAGALPEFLGLGDSCTDAADNDGDGDTDAADDGCRDQDGDTVPDLVDNCPQVSSINVLDSDNDGKGDACDPAHVSGDVNCNGSVGVDDLLDYLRFEIGLAVSQTQPCDDVGYGIPNNGDVDCNGQVNLMDLLDVNKSLAGIQASLPAGCREIGS